MLNGNRKDYGPAHMFDGEEDTCWNSDQVRHVCFVYWVASHGAQLTRQR